MLAYEVAIQLIGMDQVVEFIGMIDTRLTDDRLIDPLSQRLSDIDWLTNQVFGGDLDDKLKADKILAELPDDAMFCYQI